MGLSEKLVPAFAAAIAFGALGFILGGVAEPFVAGVTSGAGAAIGFGSALTVGLSK